MRAIVLINTNLQGFMLKNYVHLRCNRITRILKLFRNFLFWACEYLPKGGWFLSAFKVHYNFEAEARERQRKPSWILVPLPKGSRVLHIGKRICSSRSLWRRENKFCLGETLDYIFSALNPSIFFALNFIFLTESKAEHRNGLAGHEKSSSEELTIRTLENWMVYSLMLAWWFLEEKAVFIA